MVLYIQLLFTLFTVSLPNNPPAQSKFYDIQLNGMNIGQLKVYTTTKGGEIHYFANAEASIWLFGRKNITTLFQSVYKDKMLEESSFHEKLNEKTQNMSTVNREGNGYEVSINNERSTISNRRVTYSTAILYHMEPAHITELFSERYGKFCPIKPIGPGKYELTMPDGKKNHYTYVNGVCEQVEVHTNLYRFRFSLRK